MEDPADLGRARTAVVTIQMSELANNYHKSRIAAIACPLFLLTTIRHRRKDRYRKDTAVPCRQVILHTFRYRPPSNGSLLMRTLANGHVIFREPFSFTHLYSKLTRLRVSDQTSRLWVPSRS